MSESVADFIIYTISTANDEGNERYRVSGEPEEELRSGGTSFEITDPKTGERFDVVVSPVDR